MQGFLILNCIIGGQTLASVSDHLNDTLGFVIIGVISLVVGRLYYPVPTMSAEHLSPAQVTFFGYKVIHW